MTRCTRIKLLLAWLCLLLTLPAAGRELLVVGTSFPGVFEQQADGELAGLGPAVLREALVPLGYDLHFELYPWARAQQMVEVGRAHILIGPYKTAERLARFAFSARPFYRDTIVFFRMSKRALQWQGDYQRLHGLRIGVVRAWVYGARFERERDQLELVTVESVENGLRMLGVGRLDLLASNQRNTRPVLARLGMAAQVSQLQPQIDWQDGYFAFPRQAPFQALRLDFDREFEHMLEQGRLAELAAGLRVDIP